MYLCVCLALKYKKFFLNTLKSIYLFGSVGSSLHHVGSFFSVAAWGIFSCGVRTLFLTWERTLPLEAIPMKVHPRRVKPYSSPFPSLGLRLDSSGACQVSAPAQPSYILSEELIVIQRKLMIQQVLDVWSPRKRLPGLWTTHCRLTASPATKCFL